MFLTPNIQINIEATMNYDKFYEETEEACPYNWRENDGFFQLADGFVLAP